MNALLSQISSSDFDLSVGFNLPPKAMRKVLLNTQECKDFRLLYWQGSIAEEDIRTLVRNIFLEYVPNVTFKYQSALSLLAVALESFSDKFSEEFVNDLSKIELREVAEAAAIAKVCRMNRHNRTSNRTKTYYLTAVEMPLQVQGTYRETTYNHVEVRKVA